MSVSVTDSSMFAMRVSRIVLVAFVAAMLSGCYFGRSNIRTSDGGNYDIYVDGRYLCSTDEDCSITTRGAFGNTLFEAQKGNRVVGQRNVSRDVTAASILWMPFTCYLSIFVYQAYPAEIVIPIYDDVKPEPTRNAWREETSENPSTSTEESNTSGVSAWEKPIY